MKHSLVIACLFSIAITLNGQNSFPLTSSGDYTGGSGDHTNITNAQLKLQSTAAYIRVAHLSVATSISTVYNYQANKNVYWGEDSDGGQYLFRGRDVNIGRNLWVNNGATVSSDFADNDPNYSWNSNLSVRNNNVAINTFSRLSFVSQSGGMGAISLKKTDTYSGDMYFQVRSGAGFFSTPLLIKSNGNVGIGTASPSSNLHVLSSSPIGASLNSEVLITRFSTNVANLQSLDLKLRKYSTTDNYWWGNSLRLQRNIDGAVNSCYIDFGASEANLGAGSHELGFGVDNTEYMRISHGGNVGIGTTNPQQKLHVKGTVYSTEVKVDLAAGTGPDYVFEPTYDLKPLAEIETYIKENKHLPEVPSAKEMEKNGVQLGEMNMLLLRKIEELTLYILDQNKEIEKLKERTVSPDASGKKVEELTLYLIEQRREIQTLKKEINDIKNR